MEIFLKKFLEMTFKINKFIPEVVIENLTIEQRIYLGKIFQIYSRFPNLQELEKLLDESWIEYNCDPLKEDKKINKFYSHPVWLLNGLFIEQDKQSLFNREIILNWIKEQNPRRIADYGGGFGTLSRLIAKNLPDSMIEIIEPYPFKAAVAMNKDFTNLSYEKELSGVYDLIVSTDVFEHLFDPVKIANITAHSLKIGGYFLTSNCFAPVIKCHLPQHFHLDIGWDSVMEAMGLKKDSIVGYGSAFKKGCSLDLEASRRIEKMSKMIYSLLRFFPKGKSKLGKLIISFFVKIIFIQKK